MSVRTAFLAGLGFAAGMAVFSTLAFVIFMLVTPAPGPTPSQLEYAQIMRDAGFANAN